MKTYRILENPPKIECLRCGFISPHPQDIKYKYCAHCEAFHKDLEIAQKAQEQQ